MCVGVLIVHAQAPPQVSLGVMASLKGGDTFPVSSTDLLKRLSNVGVLVSRQTKFEYKRESVFCMLF